LLLQEARVCEILMQNPHLNVARYLGCYVQEGWIAGLCFQRYAETAEERKRSGRPISKALVLDKISAAITLFTPSTWSITTSKHPMSCFPENRATMQS
jgi:hypothetical protein